MRYSSQGEKNDLYRAYELISMFERIQKNQLVKLFENEKFAYKLIKKLISKKKIFESEDKRFLSTSQEYLEKPNESMRKSIWVLIDFIDKIDFYSVSNFPCQIVFISKNELYEIIYIKSGEEMIINQYCKINRNEDIKRIIVIDNLEQIRRINIETAISFCLVKGNKTDYYKTS